MRQSAKTVVGRRTYSFFAGVALRNVLLLTLNIALLGASWSYSQEAENAVDPETDVDRLRGLLMRHQGADSDPIEEPTVLTETIELDRTASESQMAAALAAPYSADKLLLRIDEWPQLLAEIERRSNDATIGERRSNSPLIGTIQTRQRGTLVGSSTYSLKHIGKHQFVGQTDLGQGRNIVSVSDFQWEIELPAMDKKTRYLLVLVAPPRQDWILHAIPASVIGSLGADTPSWLKEPSTEARPAS
ncbi:hypothetical protein R0137_09580 [Congregibacter brevis]|uniref:Uncharacterized protein n=1 Tax=Congregibacter brevis TaxID=3081201 RepID=A0ABZ0IBU5_9GAMM|nr:hypothetical protein R0137_09580 [Congregibacter sp. IMCC45268]